MVHFLRIVAVSFVVVVVGRGPAGPVRADEAVLKAAGLPTDSATVTAYLQRRTTPTTDTGLLEKWAKELADPSPAVSSKAAAELIISGPAAIPFLRRTVNDLNQVAAAERAKKCLSLMEGRSAADLSSAVVRRGGELKPPQWVDLLLAYAPYADDVTVVDQIIVEMSQLAYRDGKAHPSLLKALESPMGLQRVIAVESLTKVSRLESRSAVVKLLADPNATVRRRTAIALAKVEEVAAIPVLVDLTAEGTPAERQSVETLLRQIAAETAPKGLPAGANSDELAKIREGWTAWWKKVDGVALIDEFKIRTLADAEREETAGLIRKLGDQQFRIREQAGRSLVSMGTKVLADLRAAVSDTDQERATRAQECINKINKSDTKRVPMGSARLLALRRPAGAMEAMVAFLPYADDDDSMVAEIRSALTSMAQSANGEPSPVLLKAIEDSSAVRRMVAAEALSAGGGKAARPVVRKLLADKDLLVQQAAAVALVNGGERDAVPVVIEVAVKLPSAQSWPSQDLLYQLAGDAAPKVALSDKEADRSQFRTAWTDWWKTSGDKVDLAKLQTSSGYMGFTVICQVGNNSIGRVIEVDRQGKIRWQIGNLRYPVDAFVLPGERVLITEWDGNRVSEYDFRGNVIWKKEGLTGRATNAQRLPNGNTFICTTNQLIEVDRSGKDAVNIPVSSGLTAGYRSSTGEYVVIRNDGVIARYDAAGKEVKTFPSNRDTSWTSGIDLTRGGNILVTQPSPNQRITEYTPEGKVVREWTSPGVTTATKLSNGNILAASHGLRTVTELDASGKEVWKFKDDTYNIFRARRR